ncbi:MAG: DUF6916 family protein [Blastocatellia bacterium]
MTENQPLDYTTFASHLHSPFRVKLEPATELQLIEAKDHSTPRQEMFSLVFHGPREPFLAQQNYPIHHDRLGAFDLFLVPIGKDEEGFRYEAVFNRLRQSADK